MFELKLMVEKGIGGGMCYVINWYVKASNKYMKIFDPNKESSCLMNGHVNSVMERQCQKRCL